MNNLGIINRREFFNWSIRGIGATAFTSLLVRDTSALAGALGKEISPNFVPRAKRTIHISLVGGMSHIDSYDYKPGLDKAHGKPLGSSEKPDIFFGKVGLLRKSDFSSSHAARAAFGCRTCSRTSPRWQTKLPSFAR